MGGTAQGLLGGIRDKQRKLQEAHERTKTVTRTGEMKEIRERMQDDIEEVNKAARTVKLRIERLDKANEQSLSRKARPPHDTAHITKQFPCAAPASPRRLASDSMACTCSQSIVIWACKLVVVVH